MKIWILLMALSLGLLFSLSFNPVSFQLWGLIGLTKGKDFAPMCLAFLFYISLPREKITKPTVNYLEIFSTLVLPVFISFVFSYWVIPVQNHRLWYLISMPITEELIFRGWIFSILKRRYQNQFVNYNWPFSIPVFYSAVAFSVWHSQNFYELGIVWSSFQLFYTFFVGIWLGWVFEKTQRLWIPILFHILINAVLMLK